MHISDSDNSDKGGDNDEDLTDELVANDALIGERYENIRSNRA